MSHNRPLRDRVVNGRRINDTRILKPSEKDIKIAWLESKLEKCYDSYLEAVVEVDLQKKADHKPVPYYSFEAQFHECFKAQDDFEETVFGELPEPKFSRVPCLHGSSNLEDFTKEALAALSEAHMGDCCSQSISCNRCFFEELFGYSSIEKVED